MGRENILPFFYIKIMKLNITKIITIATLIIAMIDTQFELLKDVGIPIDIINYIKLTGIVIVSFLPSLITKNKEKINIQADAPEDIGGGGIKNPK